MTWGTVIIITWLTEKKRIGTFKQKYANNMNTIDVKALTIKNNNNLGM